VNTLEDPISARQSALQLSDRIRRWFVPSKPWHTLRMCHADAAAIANLIYATFLESIFATAARCRTASPRRGKIFRPRASSCEAPLLRSIWTVTKVTLCYRHGPTRDRILNRIP
jgi:hypothetical protein